MAKSRKDSRGYVLRTGESQRKDGRYSYTALDKNRRTVYAKTLVELRAKERKIIRDKEDGLNPQLADRMTLNELYDRFIEQKYDLKPSTKVNYLYMYNYFVRPTFGKRLIGKIKYSDVKKFYLDAMDSEQATPSLSQAQRLKKFSQEGHLSIDVMRAIMGEEKKSDLDKVTFTSDTLRKYFPKSYTPQRMQETIIKLLEQWQKKRQRDQER